MLNYITTMGLEIVCNETGCNSQFNQIKNLRKHLISVHNQIHEPEQVIEFESEISNYILCYYNVGGI